MAPASNTVIEMTRYPESSPTTAKTSLPDHSISRDPSTTATAFNNLINICATLLLIASLVLLELHIRRSILHAHPAVTRNTNDAALGISLHMPQQSNAVGR